MDKKMIGLVSIVLVGALLISGVMIFGGGMAMLNPVQASETTNGIDESTATNESNDEWQCPMNGDTAILESKLGFLAERFDLTDEQVEEIEEKISSAIEEGLEPYEIRENVMDMLEAYGVPIPGYRSSTEWRGRHGYRGQYKECEGPCHEATEE